PARLPVPAAERRALHHGCRRLPGAAESAGRLHVHRADAQRRQPGVCGREPLPQFARRGGVRLPGDHGRRRRGGGRDRHHHAGLPCRTADGRRRARPHEGVARGMDTLAPFVLLSPLAGFLINALFGRRLPRPVVGWIGAGSVGIGFIISLNLLLQLLTGAKPLDQPYFAYMNLFVLSMLILVLAGNLIWLIIGWAGVGLSSYLLISFWYERPSAVLAGRKAFVMNTIGDVGMIFAAFLIFLNLRVMDYKGLFERLHHLPKGGTVITAICLLLLVGAVAKSAQLPLHTWLPDAMQGPTPVPALIHAATMVTAGVYLVARMHLLYDWAPIAAGTVAVIGAVTALFAASIGTAQIDIKRILA